MNDMTYILKRGERLCNTSRQNFSLHLTRKQPYIKRFTVTVNILDSIRIYIKNEVAMFLEELKLCGAGFASIDSIKRAGKNVTDILEDLFMLHFDEPDGSFLEGFAAIMEAYDNLLSVMRKSLEEFKNIFGEDPSEFLSSLPQNAA
ncbi:hypothetical protein GC174_10310 [bacterium]|nr:hypothetical protein [bacterium]